ncbi:MAG: redoxin domain-containing protein [Opitutaceae bacterium]|nr:redoxin domain-containing protein [Verrucomicrobiales bacterium]
MKALKTPSSIFLVTLPLAILILTGAGCSSPAGAPRQVTDIHGRRHMVFGAEGTHGTVLIFIERECPIANSYAPEINRIVRDYPGFAFYLIQVDPDLTTADARKHATEYALQAPVIIDRRHELARLSGARVTPEAAVFSPSGSLVYLGRIDDKFAGFGKSRVEATQRDLRGALTAIASGQPVPVARTKAIGCYIPDFARTKEP